MADTDLEKGRIPFDPDGPDEDVEEYCKAIYSEAAKRNEDLKATNVENRLFYEGIDQKLLDRDNDPHVVRSNLFIHELKPAIDTRRSDTQAKLDEREFPITGRADADSPSGEEQQRALLIERALNSQLRECGYLSDGFGDHVLSAEIYRSPSAVKVGWESVYEKEPEVVIPTDEAKQRAAERGKAVPESYVRWVDKYRGGRPYTELLDPEKFLYEPGVANFQRDSEYAGHREYYSWGKLMSVAGDGKWDKKKIQRLREEIESPDVDGAPDDSTREEVEAEKEMPYEKSIQDNKVLTVEWYVHHYNEEGQERVWQLVMVGNKYLVKKKLSPYRGVRFPFVLLTANRLPNSIEGLSSIDVGKGAQQLYNELFNSFLDGISYRLFPPLIQEPGTTFKERPKMAPGAIWKVYNPEGLHPLYERAPIMPDLPDLMAAVSAKLRNLLNAEDTSQGFQSQQYEKATSTKIRAVGAAKRQMPINKLYGQGLIEVAKMFLALNQQYHENKAEFVMPVVIDVPSLTSISDPEEEKQEALLLMAQAQQSPLFQGPTGELKLRALMEDVFRKFKKVDVYKYIMTEEELLSDQQARRDLILAQQQKQTVMEEAAMSQSGG
jgi:hypothetical protein